jgi:hypothetical protein
MMCLARFVLDGRHAWLAMRDRADVLVSTSAQVTASRGRPSRSTIYQLWSPRFWER